MIEANHQWVNFLEFVISWKIQCKTSFIAVHIVFGWWPAVLIQPSSNYPPFGVGCLTKLISHWTENLNKHSAEKCSSMCAKTIFIININQGWSRGFCWSNANIKLEEQATKNFQKVNYLYNYKWSTTVAKFVIF